MKKTVERVFRDRKLCVEKLLSFGFVRVESGFLRRAALLDGQLCMELEIHADGSVHATVHDADGKNIRHADPGTEDRLRRKCSAGNMRKNCGMWRNAALNLIFFKAAPARSLIAHIRKAYGEELEFLWRKFPGNAVVRRKDTEKWYAAFSGCAALEAGGAVPRNGWRF